MTIEYSMDHSELVDELTDVDKLTPAERIAIARQRRAIQLLKWHERESAAEAFLTNGGCAVDGVTVRTLYERKPKVTFQSSIMLLEATERNDTDEVRRLLNNGADPNSHNEDGLTPLHQCAIDNNEDMLQLLFDHGADVNARDTERWTPLHAAACCGHADIVRRLIDRGASLLAVNADGNMPYDICDDEYTLDLIESEMAKRGITQEDIDEERLSNERRMLDDMQMLRDTDGDLECRNEQGATPLHVASANGYFSCAQFLLDSGCSTQVQDNDGWQPVHVAACWAQGEILELLVAYNADINACTPMNETPLDLCDDEGVRALIMTLQVEAQRKLLSFGRDSRRMSKRRKPMSKFESPTSANTAAVGENHLGASRGALRRLSVRDRAGVTLARLEARREAELLQQFGADDDDDVSIITNNHKQRQVIDTAAEDEPEITLVVQGEEDSGGVVMVNTPDSTLTEDFHSCTNNLEETEQEEDYRKAMTVTTIDVSTNNNNNTASSDDFFVSAHNPPPLSSSSTADADADHPMTTTRAISTTEWLMKVRKEDEEGTILTSLERSSPDRKGRRKPTAAPAPNINSATSSSNDNQPQQLRNGPIGAAAAPEPLYPQPPPAIDSTSSSSAGQRAAVDAVGANFSRHPHPMTLMDLKKQRAEERKLAPHNRPPPANYEATGGGSSLVDPPPAPTTNDDGGGWGEGTKYRYRAPSDVVVGASSIGSRSPKFGLRCCTIT